MRTSDDYAPGLKNSARINATLLALVRNEELKGMLQAMEDLERTWNHKFNYPWTFFNDVPFSEEFKRETQKRTKAECRYGMAYHRALPVQRCHQTFAEANQATWQNSSPRSAARCGRVATWTSTRSKSRC